MSQFSDSSPLQDLQARYAFQEDLLNSLNQTVAEQGRQIDSLQRQCRVLQERLSELSADLEQRGSGGEDAPPPHY